MSDPIDRQAAIKAFQMFRKYDSARSNSEWVDRIEVVLKNQPTIDAIELVRCRDCKWYDSSTPLGTIEPVVYRCKVYGTYHIPEFFCSIGERRPDETD